MIGIAGTNTPAPVKPCNANPMMIIGILSGIPRRTLGPTIEVAIGEIMRAIRTHFKGSHTEQSQPTTGLPIPKAKAIAAINRPASYFLI